MYKIYSKNKKIEISRIYLTRMLSVQDFTYNPLNFQYIYKKVVIIVYNTPMDLFFTSIIWSILVHSRHQSRLPREHAAHPRTSALPHQSAEPAKKFREWTRHAP